MVDAAAAFRAALGTGPILTAVGIDANMVSFGTNIHDTTFAKVIGGVPATSSFSWGLDGLIQSLGKIDLNAQMGTQGPAPFQRRRCRLDDTRQAGSELVHNQNNGTK